MSRGIFYIYGRVMDATLRLLVCFVLGGGLGWLLDGKQIGTWTFLCGGIGVCIGFYVWFQIVMKIQREVNSSESKHER